MKESDLREVVLPLLRDSVFHLTSADRFKEIESCGFIAHNAGGELGSNFPQSTNSVARKLRAVALFDFREQEEDDILFGLGCIGFVAPRPMGDEFVYLIYDEQYEDSLCFRDDLRDFPDGAFIPKVECWHVGNLALTKLRCAIRVSVERSPPTEYEKALDASWDSNGDP